jgi:hypothetical protein
MRPALSVLALLALAGPAWAEGYVTFHTPSGNIHCLAADDATMGTFVDCEILETNGGALQARPAWCELDWGHRFSMSESGPAEMGCAGDTVRDSGSAVLPYGQSVIFGAISCSSSEQGLECVNGDGRGFFLSRAAQRLF